MKITSWILQIIVAAAFGMAGFMKLTSPVDEMAAQMPWVADFSEFQVRAIACLEIAGALGVILPAATGLIPLLTPLAAAGLGLVMIGAMITHIGRGEPFMLPINLILLALALTVAFLRYRMLKVRAKRDISRA